MASLRNRLDEAEPHFKRAIALAPANHQAYSYLAGVHLQQKRLAEAESGYQQALKLKPGNPAALYNLGLIALLRQQPTQAMLKFKAVLQNHPADVPALMGLLETQLLTKRYPEARRSAHQLQALVPTSDPRTSQVAALLAVHRQYDAAIPILEVLRTGATPAAEVFYNLALAYFETGQNDRAAQTLDALPGLDQHAEALNLLGQVEAERGQLPQALEAFRKAAARTPQSEAFRFDYANQLLQQGAIERAVEAFRQGSIDFRQSWKMQVGLGAGHYLRGQYDLASQSLLEAVRLQPDSRIAFLLLGKVYEQASAFQPAIREAFRAYLEKTQTDPWAHFHYGSILYLQAQSQAEPDYSAAIQQLRQALRLTPGFAEANLQLGVILEAQGKLEESTRLFEAAIAAAPQLASAHYRLGLAYQRQGMKDKARAELESYQKLKAQAKPAEEVRSAIQALRQPD
jgi:tetratricopeptide (TPR) repeat protein